MSSREVYVRDGVFYYSMKRLKKKERLALGLLKIGEIADAVGVLPTTIRYYTDLGLLSYVERMVGGYRLYPKESTIKIMERIKELKRYEKSIEEIVKIITGKDLPDEFKS